MRGGSGCAGSGGMLSWLQTFTGVGSCVVPAVRAGVWWGAGCELWAVGVDVKHGTKSHSQDLPPQSCASFTHANPHPSVCHVGRTACSTITRTVIHVTCTHVQVLHYTCELMDKVGAQEAAAQRINKFQRLFKLEETKWVDCPPGVLGFLVYFHCFHVFIVWHAHVSACGCLPC